MVARPGRPFSEDDLFPSQRNLYSSDLFRFATVNIDTTASSRAWIRCPSWSR